MTARLIHAVSIQSDDVPATVCGLRLTRDTTCTGWGRPQEDVCPGVTCTDCEAAMGLRVVTMPPVGRFLAALGVDPATALDDEPRVLFVGDRVLVHYTGILQTTPAEFSRAASQYLPEGWKPA